MNINYYLKASRSLEKTTKSLVEIKFTAVGIDYSVNIPTDKLSQWLYNQHIETKAKHERRRKQ